MRIVVFCPHFEDTGGVREVVARVAREHVHAGHHVDIVTRVRRARAPTAPLPDSRIGVWHEPLAPAPYRGAGWRVSRRFLRRFVQGGWGLAHRMRALAPDVIATHCSKFYAPWVSLAGWATGAPVVVHLHNAGQTADGPESRFWSRLLLRSCRHVIAVSAEVGRYAVRSWPPVDGHVDVVRNGVEPGDFEHLQPECRPEPYLLAVGRLAPQKGFDVLLDALARTTCRTPLVLAGGGPEAERLTTQAARLGISPRVEFLGEVPRERVKRLLLGAFAVVMPSRFEGNPLIALEAMQAGAALIASNIPGLPPELVDGATGFLVPPEDAAALARALDRLAADPSSVATLGRAAAAAARSIPAWQDVATDILAVYAALHRDRGVTTGGLLR